MLGTEQRAGSENLACRERLNSQRGRSPEFSTGSRKSMFNGIKLETYFRELEKSEGCHSTKEASNDRGGKGPNKL